MKCLSRRMLERILPATVPIAGTITFRRSRILKDLRSMHGPRTWEYVHVASDGYEYRCVQCGRARNPFSGKRCGQCYGDNAVCKVLRPGPRGEVMAELFKGESRGIFEMVPYGLWTLAGSASIKAPNDV